MTPPASPPGKRSLVEIAQTALTPLVALVAILAIILIAPMYLRSDARPDPWTGSQHNSYSQLVDEQITRLDVQIEKLAKTVDKHVALEMHPGARVQFARMEAELVAIKESLVRIEKRLEKIEGG